MFDFFNIFSSIIFNLSRETKNYYSLLYYFLLFITNPPTIITTLSYYLTRMKHYNPNDCKFQSSY